MRRFLLVSLLTLGAGVVLPACSALGLADLPQADCTLNGTPLSNDAFCSSLSTLVPLPDDCHTWQCNPQTRHCEQQPRDDDADEYPSMACAGGQTPDCDDHDPNNHPNGMETCNGRDENCNGIIDDGVIGPNASAPVSLGAFSGAPSTVDMVVQSDADEALVMGGYDPSRFDATTVQAMSSSVELAVSVMGGTAIFPDTTDLAIASLGSMHYVMTARVRTSSCGAQWAVVPIASGASSIVLRSTDAYLVPPCASSTGTQAQASSVAGVPNGTMGHLIAVGWLDGLDATRDCGATPRDVRISGASLDYRPAPVGNNRVSADVVTLGQSVAVHGPAILALDDAFVVAFPRADGTIAVHLITVTLDGTGVLHVTPSGSMPTPDFVEPAGTGTQPDVVLARAPTASDGSTAFVLGYIDGCTGDQPITTRLITRHGTTLTPSAPVTGLGSGRGRRVLGITYQPRASEWLVSWATGAAQSAQRLHDDGTPEGDPFDFRPMSSTSFYVVEPLRTGSLYRAILLDTDALSAITFGCGIDSSP